MPVTVTPLRVLPRRCRRGQAAVETVVAVLVLCLILFSLLQVAYLYMGQMVAHHAAFVMARSYVVGFEPRVVQRAEEVGSIGMAGHLVTPESYAGLSPAQLGDIEPDLIAEFLQSSSYTLWYEHWDRIGGQVPVLGTEEMSPFRVRASHYPLEMPMHRAYMRADTVDFGSDLEMYNHAGYYLY